jgi:arylsulfatase A-like enzyme
LELNHDGELYFLQMERINMVTKRQNILLIVMDTVRRDRLSIYGYEKKVSPSLEELSKEALVLEHVVSPAPWTLPVHASLFTGLYPSEHGANQERPYLKKNSTTLATSLSESGYSTACYSSNAWITPYTGLTSGFEDIDSFFEIIPRSLLFKPVVLFYAWFWRKINSKPRFNSIATKIVEVGNEIHEFLSTKNKLADSKTPSVIDKTINFIDSHEQYFVFINLMDAHLPYNPPKKCRDKFAPDVDPNSVCQNSKEYNSGSRDILEDEWNQIRQLYDAEIHYLDSQLGRLFDWMKSNNKWDETLVIVCSDHGELHGEHGLYGHEFCIYDQLVHVPLLIKHNNIDRTIQNHQIELIDLYHTIIDASGGFVAKKGTPLDKKRSLLSPTYRQFEGSEFAFIEYSKPIVELQQLESKAKKSNITLDKHSRFYSRMRGVRTKETKYIKNEIIADEFYQIDEDPNELNNQINSKNSTMDSLTNSLSTFEIKTKASWDSIANPDEDTTSDMDEQVRNRLRDLGYLD